MTNGVPLILRNRQVVETIIRHWFSVAHAGGGGGQEALGPLKNKNRSKILKFYNTF